MLRRIRELFNDVFRQADLVLLALCIGTSLFGILMIASATRYMHTSKLVLVQAAALCIGAVLYIVVSQVDLNELAKYWKWIFLVGVVFILLLATPLGIAGDTGNKAWLEFPFLPVKVQPSGDREADVYYRAGETAGVAEGRTGTCGRFPPSSCWRHTSA